MKFVEYVVLKIFPNLKTQMKKAHIKKKPLEFIKKMFMASLYLSFAGLTFFFFVFGKADVSFYYLLLIFPVLLFVSFWFVMQYPIVLIRKREREINKEVLFAGRYILVKLQSGTPLYNALIDASKSYGVASKYFKEIVDDISTGIPIEKALEHAREYNASEKFKSILSELITSLTTGADVSKPLRSILQHITNEQIIEIKEYGKKLNAYMMLYMILAIIVPSLGMTMLVVVGAFLALELSLIFIITATIGLILIQLIFLSLFKSIRPMVNI